MGQDEKLSIFVFVYDSSFIVIFQINIGLKVINNFPL